MVASVILTMIMTMMMMMMIVVVVTVIMMTLFNAGVHTLKACHSLVGWTPFCDFISGT